jgi:ribosomal-protein-alanine N-acetyltransferase
MPRRPASAPQASRSTRSAAPGWRSATHDNEPHRGSLPTSVPRPTSPVTIRRVVAADAEALVAAARESRALHRPWVQPPQTTGAFHEWLGRLQPPLHHAFAVVRRQTGEVAGIVNLTNIVGGNFHSGFLGYYAFAGHERRGLMRAGLQAVTRHAFRTLGLHRVEANIQPGNTASIALVRACGFRQEGFSPRYLKIGGRWRDHERWALLADD